MWNRTQFYILFSETIYKFPGTITNLSTNLQTVTVKKEPEEISSTSQQEQSQIHIPQTIAVSVPNQSSQTHVETSNTNANQQHIVTQDASLQIAQVQNLQPHQIALQVKLLTQKKIIHLNKQNF